MFSLSQATPARRVLLGAGALAELRAEVDRADLGRVVLVTSATLSASSGLVKATEAMLPGRHQATFTGIGQHTPERAVQQLQDLLEQVAADGVISLGGGSVIDGCKAALHGIGTTGRTHIAVPTTLSGAEFTPSAGVTDSESHRKLGLRDPDAAPRVVLLDPEVTLATPERLWLSTGIRALDHAVETIWAPERDPLASWLSMEAIRRLRRSLPDCRDRPEEVEARQSAQVAAWWAALGLAGTTMGPSHQLGRILGASFEIPHGITSCVFLPATIRHLNATDPALTAPLAEPFGTRSGAEVGDVCQALIARLGLPVTLTQAGLSALDLPRFLAMVPAEWHPIVHACV
ncbi:MAG TPA: iron-containing alcohol dehydrogenase [Candidatus Nanopelagicaceae bacterium]|nr:iron-containing alcohol dehydrogenase [Candidatus Nanopelagicaceae bacterium]